MKVAVLTFGCRVNQADSREMEEALGARGVQLSAADAADVVIVNTCAVTGAAEQAARQAIRRAVRCNPSARVIVTGCYATRAPGALATLPGVERVVANAGKPMLPGQLAPQGRPPGYPVPLLPPGSRGRTVHLLRAQTGCDQCCSYCVVPRTRGPARSRPLAAVLAQAASARDAGYKELWLTGVHLGSYGRDLESGETLAALLGGLHDLPGAFRVRVASLEPMDVTPEVEELLTGSSRFAPHYHLPVQHGADRVLACMRRPYTFHSFRRLVERLAGRQPGAAIATDVIAGFPGETADEAEATRRALADLPLAYLHVFPYSDRPGAESAALDGKLPASRITARARALLDLGRELSAGFARRHVGSTRRALTLSDGTIALTDNYLKVRIPPGCRRNEWVDVTLLNEGPPPSGLVAL